MDTSELPLVVFTLLIQMAVGSFMILWVCDCMAQEMTDKEDQLRLSAVGVITITPIIFLSLLASLFHLGQPQYVFRALSHLETSWLSREVLLFGLFSAMGLVYAFLWWQQLGALALRAPREVLGPLGWLRTWRALSAFTPRAVFGALTCGVGALGIFTTGMIYMLPARPAWNFPGHIVSFFVTAILLGAVAVGAVFTLYSLSPATRGEEMQQHLRVHQRNMGINIMASSILQALLLFLWVRFLQGGLSDAARAGELLTGPLGGWLILRLLLGLVGGIILGMAIWRASARGALSITVPEELEAPARQSVKVAGRTILVPEMTLILLALIVVVAAETIGRLLFYSVPVSIAEGMAIIGG